MVDDSLIVSRKVSKTIKSIIDNLEKDKLESIQGNCDKITLKVKKNGEDNYKITSMRII